MIEWMKTNVLYNGVYHTAYIDKNRITVCSIYLVLADGKYFVAPPDPYNWWRKGIVDSDDLLEFDTLEDAKAAAELLI